MQPNIPNRKITLGEEVRRKQEEGQRKLYLAVRSTYGPLSGNVDIENEFNQRSTVTHDGATVARNGTPLADPIENLGALKLVEASMKTNDLAGDGRSATVILGYHALNKANKRVAAGYNSMLMKKGMEFAADQVKKFIQEISLRVNDSKLKDVASVSVGDRELGNLIADTVIDVGVNGGITVEEYQGIGVESEVVEGFYFKKGFESPFFMNQIDETTVLTNCQVLIMDEKVTSMSQFGSVLESIAHSDNKKVIVIGNVSGQALSRLVKHKMEGNIEVVTVSPAIFGNQKPNHLEDIAVVTGGTVVMSGTTPGEITTSRLGKVKKVVVTKDNTTLFVEKTPAVDERIVKLKETIKQETNQFVKDNMKKRLAMLEGKIGIIRVGGESETIAREKKMRVNDAVNSSQGARDSGIVAGGATTLVKASMTIPKLDHDQRDVVEGYEVIREALKEPFRQLMKNAGMNADYCLALVERAESGYGFNVLAKSEEPVNLLEEGVIDAALVTSQVVENGCASAGITLTTNATITLEDDNDTVDTN